jgi:hypothetical protein
MCAQLLELGVNQAAVYFSLCSILRMNMLGFMVVAIGFMARNHRAFLLLNLDLFALFFLLPI